MKFLKPENKIKIININQKHRVMKNINSQQHFCNQTTNSENSLRNNETKCLTLNNNNSIGEFKTKKFNDIFSDFPLTRTRETLISARLKPKTVNKNISNYKKKIITSNTPIKINPYHFQNNTTIKVNKKKEFNENKKNDQNKTISPLKQKNSKKIFISKLLIKSRYSKSNTLYNNIVFLCKIIKKMYLKKLIFKLNSYIFIFKKIKIQKNKKTKYESTPTNFNKYNYNTSSTTNPSYYSINTEENLSKKKVIMSYMVKKPNLSMNKNIIFSYETPVNKKDINIKYETRFRNTTLKKENERYTNFKTKVKENLSYRKNTSDKKKLIQKSYGMFVKDSIKKKINNNSITLKKTNSINYLKKNKVILRKILSFWKNFTFKFKIIDLLIRYCLDKKLRNIFNKSIKYFCIILKKLGNLKALKKYFNILKNNKEPKYDRIKILQKLKFYCVKKFLKEENKICDNVKIEDENKVNPRISKRNCDINNININNYIHCYDLNQLDKISQGINSNNIISKVIVLSKNKKLNKNLIKDNNHVFITDADINPKNKKIKFHSKINNNDSNIIQINQMIMAINLIEEHILKNNSLILMKYFKNWRNNTYNNKSLVINQKIINFKKNKSSNLNSDFFENYNKNINKVSKEIIRNNNINNISCSNTFKHNNLSTIINSNKINNLKNLLHYPSNKFVISSFNHSCKNSDIKKINLSTEKTNQKINNKCNYINDADLINNQVTYPPVLYSNINNFKNSVVNSSILIPNNNSVNYINNYNFGNTPVNNINYKSLVIDQINENNIYFKKTPKLNIKNKNNEDKKRVNKIEEKELFFVKKINIIKKDVIKKGNFGKYINDSSDLSDIGLNVGEKHHGKKK